jgi:m7GpppX diphosphatase
VLPRDSNLMSIRDLTFEHVVLLEEMIRMAGIIAMKLFGLEEDDIRSYFHYRTGVWNLHMHITSLNVPFGHNDHDAHAVIENIKLKGNYYQTMTIPISLRY